jgi:hypothetical protein
MILEKKMHSSMTLSLTFHLLPQTHCCAMNTLSGRIAQVVERPPLDHEVRGSNPSHDTMALLLRRHYEFPQCGIIKEKLLLLIIIIINYY